MYFPDSPDLENALGKLVVRRLQEPPEFESTILLDNKRYRRGSESLNPNDAYKEEFCIGFKSETKVSLKSLISRVGKVP